jgi:hypothetical protein
VTAPQGRLLSLPLLTRCAGLPSRSQELRTKRSRSIEIQRQFVASHSHITVHELDFEAHHITVPHDPPPIPPHRRSSVLENDGTGSRPNP